MFVSYYGRQSVFPRAVSALIGCFGRPWLLALYHCCTGLGEMHIARKPYAGVLALGFKCVIIVLFITVNECKAVSDET